MEPHISVITICVADLDKSLQTQIFPQSDGSSLSMARRRRLSPSHSTTPDAACPGCDKPSYEKRLPIIEDRVRPRRTSRAYWTPAFTSVRNLSGRRWSTSGILTIMFFEDIQS